MPHQPTRSLNELASLAKLATIGAGYPLGHATEIANAVLWLARRQFPVCQILTQSLAVPFATPVVSKHDGIHVFTEARAARDGIAALDLLASTTDAQINLTDLDSAHLIIALAGARTTRRSGRAQRDPTRRNVRINDGHKCLIITPDTPIEPSTLADFDCAVNLTITTVPNVANAASANHVPNLATRYDPAACKDTGWDSLTTLAARTYVPATDTSRTSGAGAGLTDND